jgi:hypothetical protein
VQEVAINHFNILIASSAILLAGCVAPVVKRGHLAVCPEKTVGQIVDEYMESPEWREFDGSDGFTYVNLRGRIPVDGVPTIVLIQFNIYEHSGLHSFDLNAMEVNDSPVSIFRANQIFRELCDVKYDRDLRV